MSSCLNNQPYQLSNFKLLCEVLTLAGVPEDSAKWDSTNINNILYVSLEATPAKYKKYYHKATPLDNTMPLAHFCTLVSVGYNTFKGRLERTTYFEVVEICGLKMLKLADDRFYNSWSRGKVVYAFSHRDDGICKCGTNYECFEIDGDTYAVY